jgi:hypothetical protein
MLKTTMMNLSSGARQRLRQGLMLLVGTTLLVLSCSLYVVEAGSSSAETFVWNRVEDPLLSRAATPSSDAAEQPSFTRTRRLRPRTTTRNTVLVEGRQLHQNDDDDERNVDTADDDDYYYYYSQVLAADTTTNTTSATNITTVSIQVDLLQEVSEELQVTSTGSETIISAELEEETSLSFPALTEVTVPLFAMILLMTDPQPDIDIAQLTKVTSTTIKNSFVTYDIPLFDVELATWMGGSKLLKRNMGSLTELTIFMDGMAYLEPGFIMSPDQFRLQLEQTFSHADTMDGYIAALQWLPSDTSLSTVRKAYFLDDETDISRDIFGQLEQVSDAHAITSGDDTSTGSASATDDASLWSWIPWDVDHVTPKLAAIASFVAAGVLLVFSLAVYLMARAIFQSDRDDDDSRRKKLTRRPRTLPFKKKLLPESPTRSSSTNSSSSPDNNKDEEAGGYAEIDIVDADDGHDEEERDFFEDQLEMQQLQGRGSLEDDINDQCRDVPSNKSEGVYSRVMSLLYPKPAAEEKDDQGDGELVDVDLNEDADDATVSTMDSAEDSPSRTSPRRRRRASLKSSTTRISSDYYSKSIDGLSVHPRHQMRARAQQEGLNTNKTLPEMTTTTEVVPQFVSKEEISWVLHLARCLRHGGCPLGGSTKL